MVEGRGYEASGYLDMSRYPGGDPDTAVSADALLELRMALWDAPMPPPAAALDDLIAAAVAGGGAAHHDLLPTDQPDPEPGEPFDSDRIDGAVDVDPWIPGPTGDPGPTDDPGGGDRFGWDTGTGDWSVP